MLNPDLGLAKPEGDESEESSSSSEEEEVSRSLSVIPPNMSALLSLRTPSLDTGARGGLLTFTLGELCVFSSLDLSRDSEEIRLRDMAADWSVGVT